jgi:hypothetical protein
MLDKDTLNRIRLTRGAAETLSNARAKLGPAFGRQVARLESAIRAAMTLCREVGGPEALDELARLEVVLRQIHGEPAARLH